MRIFPWLVLLAWVAFTQSQARLEFEVASIKPSPARATGIGCEGGPESKDPARLMCQQMSPALVIVIAYGVKYSQVAGPDWLASPRFDIAATLPRGTTREQVPVMWQNLLSDRFGFRAHHESRETTHFELVVAKNGPKLKPAAQDGAGGDDGSAAQRRAVTVVRKDGSNMYNPRMTTDMLATFLERQLRAPVTDATGLKGAYEIALLWTPDTAAAADGDVGPALPQAVQEQLGLRLEMKKGPLDMLVIDHIDRRRPAIKLSSCFGNGFLGTNGTRHRGSPPASTAGRQRALTPSRGNGEFVFTADAAASAELGRRNKPCAPLTRSTEHAKYLACC